jgi:UDP-N-acetylglucosamine 3-dehydrogenase
MRKINIGVVGVGYWGKKIVHEYVQLGKQNSLVDLHAVCDLLEENLKYCENYAIPNVAKYHKEVMFSPDVDAVNVCTPNETHYQICREALEAGKHVLVEKPMTLSSAEAYELVGLAHKQNLVLSVGHIFRFNNALRMIRDLIKNGFFGDVFYLKLRWTTLMPPIEGRDIITDLAPHPFDILHFLLGEWPLKITCKAKAYRREKLEEMAYIVAELRNNVMAHVELSWLSPGKTREVGVMGSKRCASIDCLSQDVKVFENNSFRDVYVKRNNTIEEELEHFLYCIQNNSVVNNSYLNENSGLLGAHVVRLLEIARKSAEKEKTESVDIK